MLKIMYNYFFGLVLSFIVISKVDCNLVNNFEDSSMCISIPKINLNQKFYSFNDKNNSVDKGIYLATDYDFNKMDKSLILASHSGNSSISYFKDLYKLELGDIYLVDANGFRYFYKIDKIYKIDKTGKFKYKDENGTSYLITCDKKNKSKQVVYRAKMIKKYKKSMFF